ncbi:hypothetical protein [Labrys neptuniae]
MLKLRARPVRFVQPEKGGPGLAIAVVAAMLMLALPVPMSIAASLDKQEWSFPIGAVAAAPEKIVVIGIKRNGEFTPTEVVPPQSGKSQPPTRLASFPLETNVLPLFKHESFGVEERVALTASQNGVAIACSPGQRPAGAVFSAAGFGFPAGMNGSLRIEGHGAAGYGLALVVPGQDAPTTRPDTRPALPAAIPSSAWQGRTWRYGDGVRNLVVTCPQVAATATLTAIRLLPEASAGPKGTGSWIWDLQPWLADPDSLARQAAAAGIDRLYLQFRLRDGEVEEAPRVAHLIEVLDRAGITVNAVEGDAAMATSAGRAHALDRAKALKTFKQAGHPIVTFQYDIEPYLRPEYAVDRAAGWREWAVTVKALAQVLGEPIEVVLPFWMLDDETGVEALESVRGSIKGVGVMAYRTDPALVEQIAQPWLHWQAGAAIPVGIALENGPVPDEYHRTYVRASRGEVVFDRPGEIATVRILTEPVTGSETKPAYSLSYEVEVNSSRISFMNARQTLAQARSRLERTLSAWPGFGGLLIHEVLRPEQ